MRLLIDGRFLRPPVSPEIRYLCQLAGDSEVELGSLEFANDTAAMEIVTPFRVIVGEPDAGNDQIPVVIERDGQRDFTAIPLYKQWTFQARTGLGQFSRPPEKKLPEVLRARAALTWPADALVTEWDLLLTSTAPWIREANPISPSEALALVGLFRRSRGDYTVTPPDGIRTRFPRGWSYPYASRALLPAGTRYYPAALLSAAAAVGGNAIVERLADTVFTRVARALAARDHVLTHVQQRYEQSAVFDVLYHLDAFLVQLVGAFDALARVADIAAGLGTDPWRISWLAEAWRKALTDAVPAFAPPLEGNAAQRNVIELLCCLRNNIHGDALRDLPPAHRDGPGRFVLGIPQRDGVTITDAATRSGGLKIWGLTANPSGELSADVVAIVEQMTRKSVETINEFMELTPIANLPGFDATKLHTPPSPDDPIVGTAISAALRTTFGLN